MAILEAGTEPDQSPDSVPPGLSDRVRAAWAAAERAATRARRAKLEYGCARTELELLKASLPAPKEQILAAARARLRVARAGRDHCVGTAAAARRRAEQIQAGLG
ncbi:MAG: hypothetical protein H0X35_15630 [Pseudonocardiales bacterium]|nr:hypothetical protein [Pseudonocardiales bacterium]